MWNVLPDRIETWLWGRCNLDGLQIPVSSGGLRIFWRVFSGLKLWNFNLVCTWLLQHELLLENYWKGLPVVELFIILQKNVHQNKTYLSIYKSVLITSPIGLKPCWNNIEMKLHQRYFNIVLTSDTDVVPTLCNLEYPTSDFVSFSTSKQRYFNVDPQRWNNVDPTLKCWLGQNYNRKLFCVCHKKSRNHNQHFKLLFFKLNLYFGTSD